jgi:hypothetical protein
MINNESISSYEKIRLENIERNECYLRDLGFKDTNNSNGCNIIKTIKKRVRKEIEIEQPLRQSLRIAILTPIKYKESIIDNISKLEHRGDIENKYKTIESNSKDDNDNINDNIEYNIQPRSEPSPDMSRAISANIEHFLGKYLGIQIKEFGKAAIMSQSNSGLLPRFNKYSGVVEWKNCIFLWVNIGKDCSKYPNQFSDEGRTISWFGGSKMYQNSNVVQRLIIAGGNHSINEEHNIKEEGNIKIGENFNGIIKVGCKRKDEDRVVLFARIEGEPYCCLGNVSHIKYNLSKHPVTFDWKLLDYENLRDKIYFQNILDINMKR